MTCVFPLARWLAICLGLVAPLCATAQPLTIRVRDTGYVRLAEWARWQGLTWRWLKRDESFQLTNRTMRLQFAVDSREARVDGLQVWLLHPLVSRDGEIYLSQLDVDATFLPLLSPARLERGRKLKTICLDPGHGGKDPGERLPGRQEKDYTLRLATELRDQLRHAGYKVVFTRSSDHFIELSDRPELARRAGADLFVSLHFNATDGGRAEARGSEVYCLTPAGAASTNARGEGARTGVFPGNRANGRNILLAYEIQKALVRTLQCDDRGVRRARFEVLRGATMPAVLIEAGFLSHPEEGKKIFTVDYRRQIARAITAGIQSYRKAVER
jgi:N-acetylmuramoyl-L-alanine amidase